jgi:deoxyribonuclease-1
MIILLATLSFAGDLPAYEDLLPTVPSWSTAKKRMYALHGEGRTLYCDCPFSDKVPDLSVCGLEDYSSSRWIRTEAEHVVPASTIGATRSCWEEGGRSHCLKVDPVFKAAHNDLHNIYPAIGTINLHRSNKGMVLLDGETPLFSPCDFELDEENDRVEPREEVRGDIARTYFYMEWMYGVHLSEGQRRLFLHWHQEDPVSPEERELDTLIELRQGNANPFVK